MAEILVNCGDDCCLNTGDALCCEPAVSPADVTFSNGGPPVVPIVPTIIHTQPSAIPDIAPVQFIHPIPTRELGVTIWLTNSIPFGTNCGNAHRSLLAVLLVVVVGGVLMPLYYKYVQRDTRQKDLRKRQEDETLLPAHDAQRKMRKSSVLASKRFSFALKIMTLILLILVVVGFYYLWGRDNHCTDPKLWIVKAWFFALLAVAIIVTSVMIAAMVRAAGDKKLSRTSRPIAIEMDAADQGSDYLATMPPSPLFAKRPEPKDTPEAFKEKRDLLTVQAEQVAQAEQQQRQQMHASHSQAGFGPSGTGAYC
ncbi:hypothetical protein BGZ72_009020 [Mortierella alpina]|nr:hypothetical protein BGZ72_009020 [Mortierella alpina]